MDDALKHQFSMLVARFEEWLVAQNYAAETRRTYVYHLRIFLDWIAQETPARTVAEITAAHIQQFQVALSVGRHHIDADEARPVCVEVQSAHLSAVRTCFAWLARLQQVASNPAQMVSLPRKSHRLPRTLLTKAEVRRLIEACAGSDPRDVRDRAVLEILYGVGLRKSELLALEVADVDVTSGLLTVRHGKGGRMRRVPLPHSACEAVRVYLSEARRILTGDNDRTRLFISRRFRNPLTGSDLDDLIARAAKRAKLTKRVTSHVLRHCCATHLLAAGAGLRHIQQLLGHRSLTSTQLYTQVEISDLQAVVQRCHPRGKKS